MNPSRIILYDGQCNACNAFMRFVMRRDPVAQFQFLPLQSEQAARALQATSFNPLQSHQAVRACGPVTHAAPIALSTALAQPILPPLDSLILIYQGKALLRSDAVLAIAGGLGFPWSLLTVFRLVPRPIRDSAYRVFARNRYRWFGQCNVGA